MGMKFGGLLPELRTQISGLGKSMASTVKQTLTGILPLRPASCAASSKSPAVSESFL